jgi:ribulose-phosphate 3-epimerase
MLKCSTSLWSADLANLGAEIRRVEPYSERFHIDVADGHYVHNLLFFPDQVKAIRAHTKLPLEIHLMVADPIRWIEPFVEAGADNITFCFDAVKNPGDVLKAIRATGKEAGVSLRIIDGVEALDPYWDLVDMLTVLGTAMGIKGASMDASAPAKIRQARQIIKDRNLKTVIEADGGIRRETVPLLKAAGADYIVPGSLMFKENPAEMREWLASL